MMHTHPNPKNHPFFSLVLGAALAPQALADELPPRNREAAGRCCFTWSGF
jgi:hypothetical protein